MWRTGPAFSPSRARRAAVNSSSGAPSDPQARSVWLTPERRYRPWSVRTWRSSPECDLGRLQVEGRDAARFDEREQPERLDGRAQRDQPVRVTQLADDLAGGVGLDDVAAVDALLDAVADLASDDRRDHPAARSRPRRAGLGGSGTGGHDPRIPRRLLR